MQTVNEEFEVQDRTPHGPVGLPITEQADKERDIQIKKIAEALKLDTDGSNPNQSAIYLYTAGCRVLKENQFIGTKLSDYQVKDICINYGLDEWIFTEIIHAVQREIFGESE